MKPKKIRGCCDNCHENTVVYDWDTEKHWCRNCNKVRQEDFTVIYSN